MLTVIQIDLSKYKELLLYTIEAVKDLTPDLSNYAKRRKRTWIGCEAPLTDNQRFKNVKHNFKSPLWIFLKDFSQQELGFTPELALLHLGGADCSDPEESPINGRGGECGILFHRDAGYADYKAIGINLSGNAVFGYKDCYTTQDCWKKEQDVNAKIQTINMISGTSIIFNCKNPHFGQAGPNRLCINAWRISKKRRKEFEEFKNDNLEIL